MTKYREILRLASLEPSQQSIADSCNASKKTVNLELDMARSEGNYKKVLAKYARPVLLIIDEWLLLKPTELEQHDILELLHQRSKNLLLSFVPDMILPNNSINLAEMKVRLPKQFWAESSMTLVRLLLLLPMFPNIVL